MPQVHIKKRNTKKIFVLIIFLLVFVCVVLGVFFWESKQKQEAMLVQAEIDEPARKRREGWVERDGVWYAGHKKSCGAFLRYLRASQYRSTPSLAAMIP